MTLAEEQSHGVIHTPRRKDKTRKSHQHSDQQENCPIEDEQQSTATCHRTVPSFQARPTTPQRRRALGFVRMFNWKALSQILKERFGIDQIVSIQTLDEAAEEGHDEVACFRDTASGEEQTSERSRGAQPD
jgi:hypothetical protein